jgi:hypothetical protein
MTTSLPKKAPKSTSAPTANGRVESKARSNRSARAVSSQPAARAPTEGNAHGDQKTTKQERVLTLLSRADGASINEVMQATNWQQHSVRGFLAGTVKKKLGFSLISAKAKDGLRRYRIEPKRSR